MIRTLVTWIVRGLLVGLAAAVLIAALARFGDGPMGPFPGGALRDGDLVEGEVHDWSFAANVETIEVQTVDPPVSRTTWVLVRGDELYVPCLYPEFKRWPHDVIERPQVILRIRSELYERRAKKVTAPSRVLELDEIMERKYGTSGLGADGRERVWFFRMDPDHY